MNGNILALAAGLFALTGCVPPPAPPPVAVAPAPVFFTPASPPVAIIRIGAPVVLVPKPPPTVGRHVAAVARPAIRSGKHHRDGVRVVHEVSVPAGCGTTVDPCNVEHETVPMR